MDDNSRVMFQNAADYQARYPTEIPGRPAYYAPRIENGYRLEEMVQRLASRGRLLQANGRAVVLGSLLGSFDQLTTSSISGWARNAHAPERPVDIVILDNNVIIAELPADAYRQDLQAAGLGDGRHAFSVAIPAQFSALSRHVISVRRQADGAELPGSPMILEATIEPPYRAAA